MSALITTDREKIGFLMDYDYNNIFGRLKFALGQDSSFFADIQIKGSVIIWSTRSNLEYKPFCEAHETEKQAIRKAIETQKQRICKIIENDKLIGNVANLVTTFPSDQYVFYAPYGDDYHIIIAGWGCRLMEKQCKDGEKNQADSLLVVCKV